MAKTIVYNGHTYTESEIRSIKTVRSKSMVSEECAIDTLRVEFYSTDLPKKYLFDVYGNRVIPSGSTAYYVEGSSDIRAFTAFDAVDYYDGSALKGKFYITNIERLSQNWFRMEACSAVGILDSMPNYEGGLFAAKTFSQHLSDIIGDAVAYTVDPAIASLPVSGWIEYGNRRTAIMQLCFAIGAAITYNDNGGLLFKYNEPDVTVEIPDGDIYLGGSTTYPTKASKVTVVEHAWYLDDEIESDVLFDNTEVGQLPVNDALIVFKEPYHSLAWTGTTLTTINCNCCRVTGTGQLTGQKYAHTQREHVQEGTASGKERKVDKAYLVSSLNADAVLARVWNYYHNHNEITYDIVSRGDWKVGDMLSFTDPFGDSAIGYVMKMDENASHTSKTKAVLATNWMPSNLGNDYSHSLIVKESDLVGGVWTKPAEITGKMMVVLFGGFGGGQAGYNGTAGESKSFPGSNPRGYNTYVPAPGEGGGGGSRGDYGKYIVSVIDTPAASYQCSFGSGGNGGASNGALGSAGSHSVFGSLDTDNGSDLTGEYINLVDGSVVAGRGTNGVSGKDGGGTHSLDSKGSVIASSQSSGGLWKWERYSQRGYDGEAYGQYRGGYGINGESVERTDNEKFYEDAGSGGGGAAFGANGGDATGHYGVIGGIAPTHGGNGGNAAAPSYEFGRTGSGGNGGGGGGAGAMAIGYISGDYNTILNNPGNGGTGSAGAKGSDGFALIYY